MSPVEQAARAACDRLNGTGAYAALPSAGQSAWQAIADAAVYAYLQGRATQMVAA